MPKRTGAVHVATTRRHYKGKVYETTLLRRSYREGGKVKHETLGNLSHLPAHVIELVKRGLAGETLVPAEEALRIERSLPHGHAAAVLGTARKLGLEGMLGRERSRERDLCLAMVCQRLLRPGSKLSASRRFSLSTLGEELEVADADEAELLAAMDWLLARQERVESALARRYLRAGGFVLYDLSSSYLEGPAVGETRGVHPLDGARSLRCPLPVASILHSVHFPDGVVVEATALNSRGLSDWRAERRDAAAWC